MEEGPDWLKSINPNSRTVLNNAKVEPSLASASVGESFQFERMGYFAVDKDSTAEKLVFNRTVTLKDDWAKTKKMK
jgi:glutaminyl-tRNA synthetase